MGKDFVIVGEGCCYTVFGDCLESLELFEDAYYTDRVYIRACVKGKKEKFNLMVHSIDRNVAAIVVEAILDIIKNKVNGRTYTTCIHIDDILKGLEVKV